MDDLNDLKFLADKSKEFIDKQISSYRQKHSNSGTIIGIISLFIPFFLNGLSDSYLIINVLSIIPVGLFVYAVILLLGVIRSKPLDQGFSVDKFYDLANENNFEKVLLYEIGANKSSFKDNEVILDEANNDFNFGVKLTIISILISIGLLMTNKFVKPNEKEKVYKVEITKSKNMTDNNSSNGGGSGTSNQDTSSSQTTRDIPVVPPQDRTRLNEGVEKSNPASTKPDATKKGN